MTKQEDWKHLSKFLSEILKILRRVGTVLRRFTLIRVECVANKDELECCVTFRGDSERSVTS